ncbi:hypothetical protein C8R45DRAFT_1077624 [Mycena sanguinolenta]|nr:hypothetical protein C8R45DRAFT_1077624 [Mycena sanguinolenta]
MVNDLQQRASNQFLTQIPRLQLFRSCNEARETAEEVFNDYKTPPETDDHEVSGETANDYDVPHETANDHADRCNSFREDANNAGAATNKTTLRQMAIDRTRPSLPQSPDEATFQISGGTGGDGGDAGTSGGPGGTGEGPTLGARNIVVKPVFHNLVEQPSAALQASLLAVPQLGTKLVDKIFKHSGRTSLYSMTLSNEFLLEALRIASFVYSFRAAEFAYTQLVFPRLLSLADVSVFPFPTANGQKWDPIDNYRNLHQYRHRESGTLRVVVVESSGVIDGSFDAISNDALLGCTKTKYCLPVGIGRKSYQRHRGSMKDERNPSRSASSKTRKATRDKQASWKREESKIQRRDMATWHEGKATRGKLLFLMRIRCLHNFDPGKLWIS